MFADDYEITVRFPTFLFVDLKEKKKKKKDRTDKQINYAILTRIGLLDSTGKTS